MHELEEQVKDAETKADQVLEEEAKRHREAYHKIERDRNLEIDLLCNRYSLQHQTVWRGFKFFRRFSDFFSLKILNILWNGWIQRNGLLPQTAAARRREWKNEDERVQTQVSD